MVETFFANFAEYYIKTLHGDMESIQQLILYIYILTSIMIMSKLLNWSYDSTLYIVNKSKSDYK